jgi:hypothetical protein
MSIILAIGPDVYTSPAQRLTVGVGGATWTIGAGGRNGGNAVIANGGVSGIATAPLPAAFSEISYGFDFITNAFPTSGNFCSFAYINDGGVIQCQIRYNSVGGISILRGSTLIATASGFNIALNTHYQIEWKTKIHASTGTLNLWVNEDAITLDNSSGLNTQNTGNATVNSVSLANTGPSAILKWRDIIVSDGPQIGNKRVREDLPTGTGSQDDGVPGGSSPAADTRQSVDESGDPNDGVDYAALENVGDKFLLTYPAIPSDAIVVALGMMNYDQLSAAGTGKYKPAYKVGGNDYLGDEIAPSNGSWRYHPDTFLMQSPDTATDWDTAEVNASEFGAERTV